VPPAEPVTITILEVIQQAVLIQIVVVQGHEDVGCLIEFDGHHPCDRNVSILLDHHPMVSDGNVGDDQIFVVLVRNSFIDTVEVHPGTPGPVDTQIVPVPRMGLKSKGTGVVWPS
jgi:hypothetical protein